MDREIESLESILFVHDPIGVNLRYNVDEYRSEALTIMRRRGEARSVEDVQRIVHEEFVCWFDPVIAGPQSRYRHIAEDIWRLWHDITQPSIL